MNEIKSIIVDILDFFAFVTLTIAGIILVWGAIASAVKLIGLKLKKKTLGSGYAKNVVVVRKDLLNSFMVGYDFFTISFLISFIVHSRFYLETVGVLGLIVLLRCFLIYFNSREEQGFKKST